MLKIGEFSKIAQVSVKTLRYYDRMGLLNPAQIDRFTGYRYYALSQLQRLNRILALKDLDFSLEQIQGLLDVDLPNETIQQLLWDKSRELRQRITDDQARLLRVKTRLEVTTKAEQQIQIPVVLKTAPNLLVATVRQTLPTLTGLENWQSTQLSVIGGYLEKRGIRSEGPNLLIFHQEDFREADLDVEVGTVIRETRTSEEQRLRDDAIQVRMLNAASQLVTAVQLPKTGTRADTYAAIAAWTQRNAFHPIGPWRELFYQQDSPQAEIVVEIQRPVMNVKEYYAPLEVKEMEPKIVEKEGFTLVGIRYFGKNENQEISELWTRVNHLADKMNGVPNAVDDAAIGLCTVLDDVPEDEGFEYVAGFPVSEAKDVPDGFVVRKVPPHTYAVFAHKGDIQGLEKTYEYIYETWLPQSGYELAEKIDFEYYGKDFKDFAPDSVFYIYLPIK
ncbi:MerR family transcriptional regulator [bacterium]|nr:MerR family transcriptional regulator [bacterium]